MLLLLCRSGPIIDELGTRPLPVNPSLPVVNKSMTLLRAYKPDLIVDNAVIVELKTVEKIMPVHEAQ